MKIVYLSQYYAPEMGAPAARVGELATRWARAGHEVVVLTGFPNHPTGVIPREFRGQWFRQDDVDGVSVVRTFVYATPNRGVLKRGLAYAAFALSSVVLGSFAPQLRGADVLIATSPQFLCALSGYALSRRLKVPFILEIRDLWPQSIVDLGVLPARHPMIRTLKRLERTMYARADGLVSVTDAFVRTWQANGVDTRKAVVIKNGVDLERFVPAPRDDDLRRDLGLSPDTFLVCYIGTHGLAQALGRLVEVAARCPETHFLFVGEGADKSRVVARAQALGVKNVTFCPQQPRERVPRFLAAADIVAVTLKDIPLFEQVIPSKIFEVMGCSRPLLLAAQGESAGIVKDAGAGWVVAPEHVDAMCAAIEEARRSPAQCKARGAAGHRFAREHFDRDHLADSYLDFLRSKLDARAP